MKDDKTPNEKPEDSKPQTKPTSRPDKETDSTGVRGGGHGLIERKIQNPNTSHRGS
jgi:hypothetical protein